MKPDFFDDEDMAEHTFWIRLLYQGLWVIADKAGRLEDRPARIKAKIFPYDKVNVEDGLNKLAEPKKHSPNHPPFIVRYEINGEKYIQILNFKKHQSPHHTERESEIPAFNGDLTVKERLEKGNRGDAQESYPRTMNHEPENQDGQNNIDAEFTEFWGAYPIKEGKADALKAFRTLRKSGVSLDAIAAGFNGYMDYLKHERMKNNFDRRPKLAATFLRNDRWKEFSEFKYKPEL